jgi:putative OPT family oligopeptide transporter
MAGPEPELKMSLPPQAYEPVPEGGSYDPVVPASVVLPEFTVKAIVVGVLVGIVFGAANAYLGLKVGLTVSASIPAAVIGVAVFRAMRGIPGVRRESVLETNIVQTVGSAGESLAAGVIFTLPVLILWGETPGFWPIFPLSLIGGLLGVLFMVPLRRFLIVREHGHLTYPEGTACAEVQVASQAGGDNARLLFAGMGVGALYTAIEKFFHGFPGEIDVGVKYGDYRTAVGGSITPELLGVGYIIGPRVSAVMLAGGAVGWLVIIPLIYVFGGASTVPIAPELVESVVRMEPGTIWNKYLRYIGAGAVAFGGIFTLIKATPVLLESFRLAVGALQESAEGVVPRTERDLPLAVIGAGLVVLGLLASFLPLMAGGRGSVGILAGFAVVLFSFFFVTVSSRIVGLIGSSSNPISGMTIATVLICALIFGEMYEAETAKVAVLTIGALVCIAAAIAGDTSQDLKTGYLLGATPEKQQLGEVIGVIAAAAAMSTVLALLSEPIMTGEFKAPQANLIKLVIDGVLDGNLPWALVFTGAAMAFCVEIMGLPTLAFAVGLYLPIHLATPIMLGGLLRLLVEKRSTPEEIDERRERGVLYASGLIAGAALLGVGAAAWTLKVGAIGGTPSTSNLAGTVAFLLLSGTLLWVIVRRVHPAR